MDSDTQITATVPATAPAKGKISVTSPWGRRRSPPFTRRLVRQAEITSFSPAGWDWHVGGDHRHAFHGCNRVTFGGVAATFHVDSDSQITATVPGVPREGQDLGDHAAGQATSSTGFLAGRGETDDYLVYPRDQWYWQWRGDHRHLFHRSDRCRFGSAAATFHVDSDTQITAIVPLTCQDHDQVTTPGGIAKPPPRGSRAPWHRP